MTDKQISLYKDLVQRIAKESYCERAKVGCLIVDETGTNILSFGYNGTVSGSSNVCECNGITKPDVLHAETNALTKLCKSTQSSINACLFCTLSPCMECAKMIIQCGIQKVFYIEEYNKGREAILFLKQYIQVEQI